jgi:hypothetical protein
MFKMKKTKYIFLAISFLISFGCALYVTTLVFPINSFSKTKPVSSVSGRTQDGDIIFQTSESRQCEAVRIATKSKFSHCGIIFFIEGKQFVFEAVQPVRITPLEDWIKHGKDSKYVVKRLKNAATILNAETLEKMKSYGSQFMGKEYDAYFEWTDDRIYCSELIWKVYKNGTGLQLCNLQKLKDFNLEDERVQKILKERYGNDIPLDEKVVSPSNLADSKLLITVFDNY